MLEPMLDVADSAVGLTFVALALLALRLGRCRGVLDPDACRERLQGLARVPHLMEQYLQRPGPLEELAVVGQAYESFEPLEEWYVAGLLARPR